MSAKDLEVRRMRAGALFTAGLSSIEVAQRTGVTRRSVRRWRKTFNASGLDGLVARKSSGRPSELGHDLKRKLEELYSIVKDGRRESGSWLKVAEAVNRRLEVSYHVDHIRRLVRCAPRPERFTIITCSSPFSRTEGANVDQSGSEAATRRDRDFGHLQRAQDLFERSDFGSAEKEARKIYERADRADNHELQAEAAVWLQRISYEQGDYLGAENRFDLSVIAIKRRIPGLEEKDPEDAAAEIVQSVKSRSQLALLSKNDPIAHIFMQALHYRRKISLERVAYWDQEAFAAEAEAGLADSLEVDMQLGVPDGQIGHDKRLQAVLRITNRQKDAAKRLFHESREMFSVNSLGAAYLDRDWGFFHWNDGNTRAARKRLLQAAEQLSGHLADPRALGSTFHIRSRVELQDRKVLEALRYGLAANAVHPYGFVMMGLVKLVREYKLEKEFLQIIREFWKFGKEPFKSVSGLMERLAYNDQAKAYTKMRDNLEQLRRAVYQESS
ncbi:MAG: helix-turn-helix domain-containing protein [Candidatus Binatus sp.]